MGLSKHEVYVKALLEGSAVLYEKRHEGKWHLSDEMMDFERAIGLAELTDKQYEVVGLYFHEHKEQSEAASILGISQQMVAKHITAAIKKIANIYEQWEAPEHVS